MLVSFPDPSLCWPARLPRPRSEKSRGLGTSLPRNGLIRVPPCFLVLGIETVHLYLPLQHVLGFGYVQVRYPPSFYVSRRSRRLEWSQGPSAPPKFTAPAPTNRTRIVASITLRMAGETASFTGWMAIKVSQKSSLQLAVQSAHAWTTCKQQNAVTILDLFSHVQSLQVENMSLSVCTSNQNSKAVVNLLNLVETRNWSLHCHFVPENTATLQVKDRAGP